jgi:probable phosphoglycerate mutase
MSSEKANPMYLTRTIYLVRHGENPANLTKELSCRKVDYPLTPKGRLQAEQTGVYFRDTPIAAIYASPLKRAIETAEIVAATHGIQITIAENFRELDLGHLEEMGNDPQAWQIHFQVIRDWMNGKPETYFPGGENYFMARQRFLDGIENALERSPEGEIIVVGHGGIFSTGLLGLCPGADREILRRTDFHNCAISEIAMQKVDGCWQGELIRWADASHLTGKAAELVSGLP